MKCVNEGELSTLLNIPFGCGINIKKVDAFLFEKSRKNLSTKILWVG
jgi:hypothetical protein